MRPGTVAVGFLHPGEWSHCFGMSLSKLYLCDQAGPQRIIPHGKEIPYHASTGGIVTGRNAVAQAFLDSTDCEWLFVVDSDMGFGPDTVERLITAADPETRPVVGGLCFSLRRDTPGEFHGQKYVVVPTCFAYVDTDTEVGFQPIIDYPPDTLLEVAGTGSACIILHRTALEKVRAKFGDHWYDQVTHPGGTTFSEDLSLCIRLAACDLPIYVDTSIRTTHDKHGVFLDEDEFHRSLLVHDTIEKSDEPKEVPASA